MMPGVERPQQSARACVRAVTGRLVGLRIGQLKDWKLSAPIEQALPSGMRV
jgi:hypothetical protein